MNMVIRAKISQEDFGFFKMMLESGAVQPGLLFPLGLGWRAMLINQLIYDAFHGNGWKLNLLTGRYERE